MNPSGPHMDSLWTLYGLRDESVPARTNPSMPLGRNWLLNARLCHSLAQFIPQLSFYGPNKCLDARRALKACESGECLQHFKSVQDSSRVGRTGPWGQCL